MKDPTVEKTENTRNKKWKKVSGGMVRTRSRKASKDKNPRLKVEIHPYLHWVRIGRDVKRKEMGIED